MRAFSRFLCHSALFKQGDKRHTALSVVLQEVKTAFSRRYNDFTG